MRARAGRDRSDALEAGFTLIELLSVMALTSVLLTLGGFTLRQYWLTQALHGGRDEVRSQLRRSQEQAVAETHPLMLGVRFRVGASQWDSVRYDPRSGVCSVEMPRSFGAGVEVSAASFTATAASDACRAQLPGASGDAFAFFFPRGTATGGTVTIQQPSLNRSLSLRVMPMTGRVEES